MARNSRRRRNDNTWKYTAAIFAIIAVISAILWLLSRSEGTRLDNEILSVELTATSVLIQARGTVENFQLTATSGIVGVVAELSTLSVDYDNAVNARSTAEAQVTQAVNVQATLEAEVAEAVNARATSDDTMQTAIADAERYQATASASDGLAEALEDAEAEVAVAATSQSDIRATSQAQVSQLEGDLVDAQSNVEALATQVGSIAVEATAQAELAVGLNSVDFQRATALCRQRILSGDAGAALDPCNEAIELNPGDGPSHDSRGIARALTGDFEGAIEDFAFFVEWSRANNLYDEVGAEREAWVVALSNGQNPFTSSVASNTTTTGASTTSTTSADGASTGNEVVVDVRPDDRGMIELPSSGQTTAQQLGLIDVRDLGLIGVTLPTPGPSPTPTPRPDDLGILGGLFR